LVQEIKTALKTAMRERSADKVAALRLILAALQNLRIAKRAALSDEEIVAALQKEAKKRTESKEIYEKAGRQDLAAIEDRELKIIRQWL